LDPHYFFEDWQEGVICLIVMADRSFGFSFGVTTDLLFFFFFFSLTKDGYTTTEEG
jgi:hypothetical protein